MSDDCGCARNKTDRYVSFEGIDCVGNARKIMEMIEKHISDPERDNAFWQYFMKKRQGNAVTKPDDLFLIHANINQVRELFETWDDTEALALLTRLEEECC